MSRADREKSLYIIRLNQIREDLRKAYPDEFKMMKSGHGQKEESHIMHGIQAIEQISEKIQLEYLSQEEDEEESKTQETSESEITHFSMVTQKKGSDQEDIDRITDEIMKKFCPQGHVPRCLVDIKGHKSIFNHDFLETGEEEKN
jgi:hypothetical protein